jgi:asparagine synthase (glutamine-hydrolysing)
MQWVAGYIPSGDAHRLGWQPRNGLALDWPTPVWAVGVGQRLIRTFIGDSGHTILTVIGHCLAADEELRQSLSAVQRGDWPAIMQWPGRYWAVIKRLNEVRIIGDLAGAAKVFYAPAPGGWFWSTAATPLAAWRGAEPDLAAVLLDITTAGLTPFGGSSLFASVSGVPAGSLLSFQNKPMVCPWYVPALSEASFEQGAERFAHAWIESMRRRARYTVFPSGEISGGTDSSAIIATLVAMLVEGGDAAQRVLGLTMAQPGSSDVQWARAIAAELDGLRHEIIDYSPDMLHFEGFDDPDSWIPLTDQPSPDICGLAELVPSLHRAKEYGSEDYLIGLGGDEALTAHPTTIATARMRDGKLGAWQIARGLAHEQGANPVKVAALAYRQLVRMNYAQAVAEMADAIAARRVGPDQRQTGLAWCEPLASAWWLTDQGAKRVSERLQEYTTTFSGITDPELFHVWLGVRRSAMDTDGFRQLAAAHGIEVHMPYFDPAVLEAALELAGYTKEPPGRYKSLMRENRWLTHQLPPTLSKRNRKGGGSDFTAVEGQRVHEATLLQLLTTSPLVEAGFLHAGRVNQALRDITDDFKPPDASPYRLLTATRWLKQLRTSRTDWWEKVLCMQPPG